VDLDKLMEILPLKSVVFDARGCFEKSRSTAKGKRE
jgi:hypothetical protein